jgi:hypothetical protein
MMLCDRIVKMVIGEGGKIDFITRRWLIMPLKANDKHCEKALKTSACRFHKLHDGEIKINICGIFDPFFSLPPSTRKAHEKPLFT